MTPDKQKFDVCLVTFGAKYKHFAKADLYFDCQVFTDPNSCMPHCNGKDQKVQDFLEKTFAIDAKQRRAFSNILEVVIAIAQSHARHALVGEETEPMLVGLFCFGGRQRSVGVSEMIKTRLESLGFSVRLDHRDIFRKKSYCGEIKVRKPTDTCRKITCSEEERDI